MKGSSNGLTGRGFLQSPEEWTARNRYLAGSLSRLASRYLPAPSKLGLDVGCQKGELTDYLNDNTDISWEGIDRHYQRSEGPLKAPYCTRPQQTKYPIRISISTASCWQMSLSIYRRSDARLPSSKCTAYSCLALYWSDNCQIRTFRSNHIADCHSWAGCRISFKKDTGNFRLYPGIMTSSPSLCVTYEHKLTGQVSA